MTRYIALLRAINVGSHRVKMEHLRQLFAELGFSNVGSYINSGNIFFDSDSHDRQGLRLAIGRHLQMALGYEVPVFLRTVAELETILEQQPFQGIEQTADTRFCVVFTDQPISPGIAVPQQSAKHDMDLVAANTYEAFVVWHIIAGRPPSGKFPAEVIPPVNTSRFYHTLIKIVAAAKA